MSSITNVLDHTIKMVVTCVSILLAACNPLLLGGITGGLDGSSSATAVTQCSTGGPADLSGVCRETSAPTMGALEIFEPQQASTASVNTATSIATPVAGKSPLLISWSPYQEESTSGYLVYYGPTLETATNLASDLPIGASNLELSAPSVSFQPTLELGLNTGDSVCFRILAYDTARVPYDWSEIQCTVV